MDTQQGQTPLTASTTTLVLWLLILIVPLAIGVAWGTILDDDAYVTFHYAHSLATGRAAFAGLQPAPRSPLYVLALSIPAVLGIPLPQIGLVLSALGWGTAALAIYGLCQTMKRPVAAITSAALVVFSPALIPVLGTETSCLVALAWIAVALGASERWSVQTGAMVLMLCLRFEPSTLAIAALLLGMRWSERRRFPLALGLGLAIVALAWGVLARLTIAAPLSSPYLDPAEWLAGIEQLTDESDLYWLFLPPIGAGLWSLRTSSRTLWFGLPGIAIAVLSGDAIARALTATLGLVLAGLGVDTLSRTILKVDKTAATRTRLNRLALATGLVLVIASPLVLAQASSLVYRYRFRPVHRQALERQAGEWLRAHSERNATVLGSVRIGFLSGRSSFPWNGDASDTAAFASLMEALARNSPDYCVSHRSLYWDRLTRTGWFQDNYALSQRFRSSYDATSPFTVWHYVHATKPQPVEATFGDQIRLVSFEVVDSIAPGENLAVRLYWKALQPIGEDYIVFVHLIDATGERVASHDGVPREKTSPTSTWFPGDIVPDAHRFDLAPDVPAGTYQLWVGMYTWPDIERLPVRDREGTEQANRTLFLRSVNVQPRDD
jgi:hypothetical protein